MFRILQILLFTACQSDIAIITRQDKLPDTAEIDAEEPAAEPSSPADEPSSEPSDEMTELTIGFAEVSLTQICLLYTSPSPRDS